jgi:hypothetical protein
MIEVRFEQERAVIRATAAVVVLLLAGVASAVEPASEQRLDEVQQRGMHVMPFDLDRTTHVFESTADGGTQRVIAKDRTDAAQIDLIRRHLKNVSTDIAAGDLSGPISIHGADMPGVAELSAGAARLRVEYGELPDGALIRYSSADPKLIDAIHRWFAAQLRDHARHAHGAPATQ